MENNGKHALVTGATSGIGYELAKAFARNGYNLVLVARSAENLAATEQDLLKVNPEIHSHKIAVDLFERGAAQLIYEKCQGLGIRIDVLVNDAGQGEYGVFWETDLNRELDIVQLNISSLISLTKIFLKDMVARNEGMILQVASAVSKVPSPYFAVYAATKAFVLSFTEALAEELEGTGVTVSALLPNATDTDFFHKAKMEHTKTYREGSMQTPEEVATAGYDGLISGEKVIMAGLKTKLQHVMNTLTPDSTLVKTMAEQNAPSEKSHGRTGSAHTASRRERESIAKVNGDY